MTQKEALMVLKMGHSVFLTGAAGSGKTYVLNQYIDFLRSHVIPVGITASTGIAATHMGGMTIHSWSGIGIRDVLEEKDIKDIAVRGYLRSRFSKTKVLIIDEVSMLHAHQLDMVDKLLRTFHGNDYPFGGIQVIMSGDFFQLPPVQKGVSAGSFVTESEVWQEMDPAICYLDESFRQDDRAFLSVLNAIRDNEVNETTVEYLTERMQADIRGYAKPTRLYTHNADVDTINQEQLAGLHGDAFTYEMSWQGSYALVETLKRSCLAPQTLHLKVGSQVMFVKNNFEEGYVNGTLGEVISFSDDHLPIVRTFDGKELKVTHTMWEVKEDSKTLASLLQLPLRLAWAITVHKSQGMSLDAAEMDLSRSFTPGMGYVALSRVRSLGGLRLLGMNPMALTVNPAVSAMDDTFRKKSDEMVLYLSGLSASVKAKKQKDYLEYMTKKDK